jgi:hypothetical protein
LRSCTAAGERDHQSVDTDRNRNSTLPSNLSRAFALFVFRKTGPWWWNNFDLFSEFTFTVQRVLTWSGHAQPSAQLAVHPQ